MRVGGTCGKFVRYFTNEAGGASSSVTTEKARTPPQSTWHSFRAKLLDPPSAPILPCLGPPLPPPTSIPDFYPASDPPAPTQLPSASGSAPDSDPGSRIQSSRHQHRHLLGNAGHALGASPVTGPALDPATGTTALAFGLTQALPRNQQPKLTHVPPQTQLT